jgi:hypothetical protein
VYSIEERSACNHGERAMGKRERAGNCEPIGSEVYNESYEWKDGLSMKEWGTNDFYANCANFYDARDD